MLRFKARRKAMAAGEKPGKARGLGEMGMEWVEIVMKSTVALYFS